MLIKKLSVGKKQVVGRNSFGRLTIFHRGGGHKRKYRLVDFDRKLLNIPGQVVKISYDPNRSGSIALVCYSTGVLSYVLATEGLKVGDWICCVESSFGGLDIKKNGSTFFLKDLAVGDIISNLELFPGSGGKLLRAAGCSGLIMKHDEELNQVLVKLRSGELRLFSGDCKATFGTVSNVNHRYEKLVKAGQSRWLGKRPVVRGVAMNPVDHPHGGGEGKTSGGRLSVTPWGKLTKGKKTRKVNKKNVLIVKRRK